MKPPAIIFLVPGFPQNEEDTECIPLLQSYILYFARLNPAIKTAVITFQYPYFIKHYRWHGIDVYSAGGKNKRRLCRIFTWARVIYYFLRLHIRFEISVIHSFWLTECAWVGQWLAKAFKLKHVATIGGQDAKPTNRFLKALDFAEMRLTCWSKFSAEVFHHSTGHVINNIIPIGLDYHQFNTITVTSERTIDILGVGSLISIKNFALFIELVAALTNEFPNLSACIIGEGPQRPELEQLIQGHNHRQIQLLGQLRRREVIHQMTQSKILLHTSFFESQGYVFMEALYCGMSVVSFDVGYLGQTAKAFPCKTKQEMLETLRDLLRRQLTYDRVLLKPLEETVTEFKSVYGF